MVISSDSLRVARNNNIPYVDSGIEIIPGGSGATPSIEVLGGLNIVNKGELGDSNINIINNSNWPLTLSSLSAIEMNCQQLTISNIFAEALPSIGVVLSSDRTIAFNLETSKGVAHTISLNGDDHIMNFDMEVKASNLITGGFIKKGSYNYLLPNKAGIISLLDDVELWHLYLLLPNIQINNKDGFLGIDLYFNKNGYNFLISTLTLQEGFGTASIPNVDSFLKQLCRSANNFSLDTASNILIPAFGECTLTSGQTKNIIGMNANGEVLFIQDNLTHTLTINRTTVSCIYRLTKILG